MTFKDLQRLVQSEDESAQNFNQLQKLKDKPFWIWGITEHKLRYKGSKGTCCFNHIIGLKDKEQTSHNDILDAFRLSLQYYKRGKA